MLQIIELYITELNKKTSMQIKIRIEAYYTRYHSIFVHTSQYVPL
jgi:hypothetical protein